jgi:hypothetical protein
VVVVVVAVVVIVVVVVVVVVAPLMSCMYIRHLLARTGLLWRSYLSACNIACTRCKYAWNDHQMKEYSHPAL